LAAPLPAVAEKVSALALPRSVGELARVSLSGLPLHLSPALQHAPAPRPPHASAVVQHQDAFPVELVVLEKSLVHPLLEVELALPSFGPARKASLVEGVVGHAVLAKTVRLVVLPTALNRAPVRQSQLSLPVGRSLSNLPLVRTAVGEGEVNFLVVGELSQEKLPS